MKTSTANLIYSIEQIMRQNIVDSETTVNVNCKLYTIIQELEDNGYKED